MATTTNTKTVNTSGVTYDSTTNVAQNWIEVAPAGANIFAIQDNTLSASIKVLGKGDTIYIEGNFADYQYKQNGKTITMDNGIARVAVTLSSMTTKVQVTTTLVFLDGSVTLTNKAGGVKVSMNGLDDNDNARSQLLTTKYADVKINANDSNTTAATYFTTTEDAALVDQQNQVLFTAALKVYETAHAETQVARAAAIAADNNYDAAAAAVIDAQSASVAEALAVISIEASVRFEAAAAKELLVATELTRLAGLTTSTADNALAVVATDEANAAVDESALMTEYAIENEAAAEAVVAGFAEPGTFALTTGIDVATATVFDGSLSSFGLQTLNSGDKLTGELITGNSLDAQIVTSVTPANLTNIQTVEVSAVNNSSNYTGVVTLGLINATGTTTLINDGSARDLRFTNVASSANNVTVQDTSNNTEVDYTLTAGDQTVNLTVSNVSSDSSSTTSINIDGVETFNIVSSGAANEIMLDADAAQTLNISGAEDLDLFMSTATVNVSNVNASALTGDLWLNMRAQTGVLSTTVITVTSGQGDDYINTTNVTQLLNVTLGDGDDFLEDNNITVNDTVDGGLGFDTLETTYSTAVALAATNNVNGIEELELSNALAGDLNLTRIDSTITELELSGETGAALITSSANVTGAAGTLTVDFGDDWSIGSSLVLAADLTVTDTGTAITDTVVFNNFITNGTGTNLDVFADQNITSTGYENVIINTGAASNATATFGQNIGDLTITADAASAPVSLVATGTNSLNIDELVTNSTGLTTVDASGLDVLATEDGLTLVGTTLGALGTESILGSAGMDVILVGNFASTIDGAAGDDILVGGTLADVIDGGTGNDTIASTGGNDVIRGGAGDDLIAAASASYVSAAGNVSIDGGEGNDTVALFDTLLASDSVDGGTGTDQLYLTTTATGTTAVGVKNFEVLATSVDQRMSDFVNNTGWTTVALNAQNITINNASATLNTLIVNENVDAAAGTSTVNFIRLTDTGTDSLTFATSGSSAFFGGLNPAFDGTITTLAVNDEESLTIDVSNGASSTPGALTINNLNAGDLTSLTLMGDHAVTINNIAQQTTKLTTINATGITAGSVSVNAVNMTVGITATGSATVANTLTTGSGADSITGGSAADILTGNNGADTLIGAAGNDTLSGGGGADQINAGTGLDSITGGTQADAVTLTVDGQKDTVNQNQNQLTGDSVAATATAFQGVTFTVGDTITFGNGVDVVNNFLAGNSAGADLLEVGTIFDTSVLGSSTSTTTVGWLSGTYAGGVFTVAANGVGPDTLVLQASTLSGASRAVVLAGVDSDNLVNSNFGGLDAANVVPLLTGLTANAFSVQTGSQASGRAYISTATGIFSDVLGASLSYVNPNPALGWVAGVTGTQAALTSVDLSNLGGGFGVNLDVAGATSSALASVTTTSGDDVIIEATEDFGAAASTVNGGTGTDTLRFTTYATDVVGDTGAGITSIENIELMAGATSLTLDNTVATVVAISNESATAAASVVLGTGAAHTFTGNGSGVQTVTVGNVGQSVTTGSGSDQINLAAAGAFVGTYNMGTGGADVLALGTTGVYDLRGATITAVDTLDADGAAYGLILNSLNVASLVASGATVDFTNGTAVAQTLTLAAGTYDFTGATLSWAGADTNVIDLNAISGTKTLTLQAADVANVDTITGDTTAVTTTLNFTDTTSLSGVTVTNLDVVTVSGATGVTLSLDGSDFTATNFTTVQGDGDNGLIFSEAAATNLTNTAISGFDTVDSETVGNNDISVDGVTFGAGAFNWVVDTSAATGLVVASTTNGSNWTIAQSSTNDTFDTIILTDAVGVTNTFTANSSILGAALDSVTASAASTGVNTFVVNAAAAASAIDTSDITTVTNLDAIQLNDGAGNNTITVSDSARAIATVSLANGGSDTVVLNNVGVSTGGGSAAITSFDVNTDVLSTLVGATVTSNGAFFSSAAAHALTVGQIEEVLSTTFMIGDLTNTASVLTALTAAGCTAGAANAGSTVIVYDGAGTAGIYQVAAAASGAFTSIELVGTVNAANDALVAANFV